ncbi:MAG: AMP-binding protein, partial [Eubacteriales bacterium]
MKEEKLVYDVRPISTIRELIETSADEFGERTAFVVKKEGETRELSYCRVLADVRTLATFLDGRGLEGKKVAVIGKNSYEWSLTYLAVTSGVGIIVPIDKDLKAPEIANILTFSEAAAVVYSAELAETVVPLAEQLGIDAYAMAQMETYLAEGAALLDGGNDAYARHRIDPFALGVLIYTSGTTGVAKGVMLSQHNICSDIVAVLKQVKITSDDRTLSVLPLHHTYESMAGFLSMLYAGGSIAYMTSLTHLLADFKEYQPTIFIAVPLLLKTIHGAILKKVKAVPGGAAYLTVGKAITTLSGAFTNAVAEKVFGNIHAVFGGRLRLALEPRPIIG